MVIVTTVAVMDGIVATISCSGDGTTSGGDTVFGVGGELDVSTTGSSTFVPA